MVSVLAQLRPIVPNEGGSRHELGVGGDFSRGSTGVPGKLPYPRRGWHPDDHAAQHRLAQCQCRVRWRIPLNSRGTPSTGEICIFTCRASAQAQAQGIGVSLRRVVASVSAGKRACPAGPLPGCLAHCTFFARRH